MEDPDLILSLQNCNKNYQNFYSTKNHQTGDKLLQNSILKHANLIDDIVLLLQKVIALYKQLQPGIEDVMKIHPELGPLISNLCKNSSILLHKQCCHLILEILLWFFNDKCTTELQRYANEWVLDQLNQCVSLQNDFTFCPQLFGKWNLHSVLKQKLKYFISNNQLLDNPDILTMFIESADIEDLLDTIPAGHILDDNSSVSSFLYLVGDKLKQNKIKLSKGGKLKIWKLIPSVVEWEVVTLLHKAANNECIKDNLLFEGCNLEVDISRQVFSILSKILSDSAFHPVVLKCLKTWLSKIQMLGDVKWYPVQLQHLIVLLQVNSSNLISNEKFFHVRSIIKTLYFNLFNKHYPVYEMKAALLLFPEWLIIILYCMLGQETQLTSLAMKIIFVLHEECSCFVKTIEYVKEFKSESINFEINHLSEDTNCKNLNLLIILICVYSDVKNNEKFLSLVQSVQNAKEFGLLSNWVKNHLIVSNLFNNKLT